MTDRLLRRFSSLGSILALLLFPVAAISQETPAKSLAETGTALTLQGALERARANSQQLQSAALNIELAREDRLQARAALLPSLAYNNQYIYTQGNGTPSGVFVANDGVHVYNSQATIHEEPFSMGR